MQSRPESSEATRTCVARARISPALLDGIERAADASGMTVSQWVRKALADRVVLERLSEGE